MRWTKSSVLSTKTQDSSNTSYMSNVRILSIAILTAVSINGMAQSKSDTTKQKELPSILGGVGVLYFNGNIGKESGVTAYSTVRGGYTLGVEERLAGFLGVQLSGLYGKLASSERSDDPTKNKNFQSTVLQGELDLNLHFDGFLISKTATIAPFIYAGISFASLTTATDSLSAAGTPYYYWTDGSIRNEAQNAYDITTAKVIQRDYVYETPLGSSSALSIPIGLGAKFRITDNICMNVQAAYYFSFSKNIEHYSFANAKNDKYLFSFFTVEYHFTPKDNSVDPNEKIYDKVDFTTISVKDTVKANDISKDQENALLEKEKNRDTSAVDRAAAFFADPNAGGGILKDIDKGDIGKHDPNKIPERIRAVDKNHDGYITSQEITQAIDEFFDGTSTLTIADINYAIDYFFDQ